MLKPGYLTKESIIRRLQPLTSERSRLLMLLKYAQRKRLIHPTTKRNIETLIDRKLKRMLKEESPDSIELNDPSLHRNDLYNLLANSDRPNKYADILMKAKRYLSASKIYSKLKMHRKAIRAATLYGMAIPLAEAHEAAGNFDKAGEKYLARGPRIRQRKCSKRRETSTGRALRLNRPASSPWPYRNSGTPSDPEGHQALFPRVCGAYTNRQVPTQAEKVIGGVIP